MSAREEDKLAMVTTNWKGELTVNAFPFCLKSFLDSSKFSDLTIKVDDCDFKVHKLVVCAQSEYFDRLFNHEWKETVDNVIKLEEDDPRAIEAMIDFMYGHDYDSSGNNHGRISPMLFNVKVYRVADKYGVATLKELSKEKFDHATSTCWNMDDFPHVITDVYGTSQYQEFREKIAQVSHKNMKALLKKDSFLRVLEETSGFAADLVQLMAGGSTTRSKYRCPSCNNVFEARLVSGTNYYCLLCAGRRSDWNSYAVSRD